MLGSDGTVSDGRSKSELWVRYSTLEGRFHESHYLLRTYTRNQTSLGSQLHGSDEPILYNSEISRMPSFLISGLLRAYFEADVRRFSK